MNYIQQAEDFATKYKITLKVISTRFGSMSWDKNGQKRMISTVRLERNDTTYSFDFGHSVADSCAQESQWDVLRDNDKVDFHAGLKAVDNKPFRAGISFSLLKKEIGELSTEKFLDLTQQLKKACALQAKGKTAKAQALFDAGKISRDNRDRRMVGIPEDGIIEQTIHNAIKRTVQNLKDETAYSLTLPTDSVPEPSMYDILTCLTKYDPGTFEDFCSDFGYDTDSRNAEKTYNAVCKEWKAVERLFGDILEKLREIE